MAAVRVPFVSICVALCLVLIGASAPTSISAAKVQPLAYTAMNASTARVQATRMPSNTAMMFIENVGQFPDDARFLVRGAGNASIWLAQDSIWITLLKPAVDESQVSARPKLQETEVNRQPAKGTNIRLGFVGANPEPKIVPFDRLNAKISYFIGNDPSRWRPGVPVWGGVRYVDLYPGIDLEVTGTNGQYTQRLVIHDGAEPGAVRLRVDGADALAVEDDHLNLMTPVGEISVPLLQVVTPGRALDPAATGPRVSDTEVIAPFAAPVQPTSPASPDNLADVVYSTLLGGWTWDRGMAIAVNAEGNAYIIGETWSSTFPTTPGAWDQTCGSDGKCNTYEFGQIQDAFVAKLDASGSYLEYATFLGGSNVEEPFTIAVDGAGCAYLSGLTGSSDFPTTLGALDGSCGTDGHCNFDGSDFINFSTPDAFVVKLSVDGSALAYATFLGGSSADFAYDLAVDSTGNAYVVGSTSSPDFPVVPNSFDTTCNGSDGFVAKINSTGSNLIYSTFLGGSDSDSSQGIAVDGVGNAFVTGSTWSPDFPIPAGAFDASYNGEQDAFVAKLNAGGTELIYATFLGGSGRDFGTGIAVDLPGSAYVTGGTYSSSFPATVGAFDVSHNGNADAFAAKVTANGAGLVYATFLGGGEDEYADRARVDGQGNLVIEGSTDSPNLPVTPDAFDASCGTDGACNLDGTSRRDDLFVARLNASGTALPYSTYLGGSQDEWGQGIAIDGLGHAFVVGETYSTDFPTTVGAFDTGHNGERDALVTKLVVARNSISGLVRQANGSPFAGVTVQSSAGQSDVTDANGAYRFDALLAGTYVLTPFRSGYTFSPASRSATLPPDTAGQSFTILPLSVSTTLMPGTLSSLSYNDTQGMLTSLAFPADAVDQTTHIALTPTLVSREPGFTFAGHAFHLEASQGGVTQPGFTFGAAVTVTIHYSDNDMRVVSDESYLALWWRSGSGWQDAAQTCDPVSAYARDEVNNVLSVPVCHLSLFGLFGPTQELLLPLVVRQLP